MCSCSGSSRHVAHRHRWTRRGGDWDLVFRVAMWGVAGGIVGARLYHVLTSWSEVPDPKWQGVFEIWKGGLGLGRDPRRRDRRGDRRPPLGDSVYRFMDAVAPGLCSRRRSAAGATTSTRSSSASRPIFPGGSRSTSRTGPRSTSRADLPPALPVRVDLEPPRRRLPAPRRSPLQDPPPALFALYVAWYTAFRTYEETLRIDRRTSTSGCA